MSLTIASYGGGTNRTAMLIECAKRLIKVDLILFADTGGERPHTYKYIRTFNNWLVQNGIGLGRRFSWGEVIEQQDAFGYDLPPVMACGCYDG